MGTGLRAGTGMLVMTLLMALAMTLVAALVTMVGASALPLIPSLENQAHVHEADRARPAENL